MKMKTTSNLSAITERVSALLAEMTLEEKASLCSGKNIMDLKGIPRLAIPSISCSDGPHGLKKAPENAAFESLPAVCFPADSLTACSFDDALLEEEGHHLGIAWRNSGTHILLGPSAGIKRSPLCGRNFEYFSEDPVLSSGMASAYIRGVQAEGVSACVKHFAANNQEYCRFTTSSEVDERTLHEIYLYNFERIIKNSNPDCVMVSYNMINGTYMTEQKELLTDLAREKWGYDGLFISDWSAVRDRVAALAAGLDLAMPGEGPEQDEAIVTSVKAGILSEELVDRSAAKVLTEILLADEKMQNALPVSDAEEKAHAFAIRAAAESIVLLKNDGVLPLQKGLKKLAVIGGFAEKPRYCGGGSSSVKRWKLETYLNCLRDYADFTYAQGFSVDENVGNPALAEEALRVAAEAETVLIFAGVPESLESEGFDKADLKLPEEQNRLIREIAGLGKKIVVVLNNGSPVEFNWEEDVNAILTSYLGGEGVGKAVADILFGTVRPSGKLAETWPIKCSDNPTWFNFPGDGKKICYREGVFIGYRYYEMKEMPVRYPFGHGESYTSFSYSGLKLDRSDMTDQDMLTVTLSVKNTGHCAGKEIVQLYLSDLTGTAVRPQKELAAYTKVALSPGEEKKVTFCIGADAFGWYNEEIHDRMVSTGTYEIQVGASSADIRLRGRVEMKGTQILPISVSRDTTLKELILHPVTKPLIMEIVHQITATINGASEVPLVSEEQLLRMIDSMPLRQMHAMLQMSNDDIDALVAQLQQIVKGETR